MSVLTRPDRPGTARAPARPASLLAKLNRPVIAVLAVGLIAGYVRFLHLGYPEHRVFDEYYYTKSACIYLGYSNERCDINSADERFWRENEWDTGAWVHPPLGKLMIAAGELAFGTESFGWRAGAAAAGTASVMVFAVIVQLLFASPIWTFAGGLLLATESLHVVQSRTGTLDIFLAFWIVLGMLFLLLDRRWIERRTTRPPPRGADDEPDAPPGPTPRLPAPLWRPYRLAAGASMGAAMAVKWSGLTGVVTAVVLAFGWEAVRRKRFGMRHPIRNAIVSEGFGLVVFLMVMPALVYTLTYTGWFVHFDWDLAKWIDIHGKAARFHADLQALNESGEPWHAYFSPAWQWILLRRPVYYYADYSTEGIRQVIYANGNPAIFWGAFLAIPYVAYAWWRRRDWRAGFTLVAIAGLYLPWFLVSRPQFLFYATPIIPFFVLACVYTLRDLSQLRVAGSRSRPYLPVAIGSVALSVMLFAWFWPVLTAGPLSDADFKLRYWFSSWV